jgi:hypothetical protein
MVYLEQFDLLDWFAELMLERAGAALWTYCKSVLSCDIRHVRVIFFACMYDLSWLVRCECVQIYTVWFHLHECLLACYVSPNFLYIYICMLQTSHFNICLQIFRIQSAQNPQPITVMLA